MAKIKIYSPNQILAGSFFGGPLAMVYVLWKNFQALESPHGMHQILLWGSIFIVALILFSPLMPSSWPAYALPFGYALAARSLAARHQMTKRAILASQRYEFQSIWNVVAVSIAFLTAMILVTLALFLGFEAFGLI